MADKTSGRRGERRIQYGDDLIWGIHPVTEMLLDKKQHIKEIFLQKEKRGRNWEQFLGHIKNSGIKYHFLERITIAGAPDGPITHQGVVARVTPVPLLKFADLLAGFSADMSAGLKPRILTCDTIQDPHNLGAIIRSAHAAGVNRILLPRERSAPLGGVTAKASAGAISKVDICQVTNLSEALKAIKDVGGWVFGAVKEDQAQSIYLTDFTIPVCLVIGSEEKGIRPLVRKQCDVLISIPMVGSLDSLNSSVAGAVIMFEMHRQLLTLASG